MKLTFDVLVPIAILCSHHVLTFGQQPAIQHRDVQLESGVSLHMIECGQGVPIIFVHGSTGDYSVWQEQVTSFSNRGFRAIAYSRRYNYPNKNKLEPNHSASVEAADLAALFTELKLTEAHVVGHSYGAYTALLFALSHPDRIKTVTLAEPPIVPWLTNLPGPLSVAAQSRRDKLYGEFIQPVKASFAAGNDDEALRQFLDFVAEKGAIDKLPKEAVDVCRRNILELKALMESEQRYPPVPKDHVRQIEVPVLVLSGDQSEDVGFFTDPELQRLLPRKSSQRIVLEGATHLMWTEKPTESREAVIRFIRHQQE